MAQFAKSSKNITRSTVDPRTEILFRDQMLAKYIRTDRIFARLMLLQWIVGIGLALWLTPLTWAGAESATHPHVWAAVILGGIISGWPICMTVIWPGHAMTRHAVAAGQMLTSALLIHLTGGRIETHFHVFGSLAFLAFYRDWTVILTATVVVAADHFVRGLFWPLSVYGDALASPWRWLEHAGWVIFEDVILFIAIRQSQQDAHSIAERRAQLENTNELIEAQVKERTLELEAVHQRLMDAARRAGMAEIATGVLHNVGNVLNSVNVSAGLASERLQGLQVEQLERTIDLIDGADDLASFFTTDAKGKQVPAFLRLVANRFSTQRESALQELKVLTSNLEHINAIISTQQSYAGMGGLIESLDVSTLVDDALRLNTSSFYRHGIEVIREDGNLPRIQLDKQRVLQILVNLVQNARESLIESARDGVRRLTLKTQFVEGESLQLVVQDTGAGISKENLQKIFSHGFTTKRTGHGFGLHNCANAAQEMGGSLSVQSDGPGCGATFTLTLPVAIDRVTDREAAASM